MKKILLVILPYLIAGAVGVASYAAHSSNALEATIGALIVSMLAHYNLGQDPKALSGKSDAADAAKKVGGVVFVLLGLGAVCATSQTACTPAEQQQISKIAPEAAACVFAIVEDVSVAPDIAGTIAKCGVTASDIYALVASLLAQKSDAGADAALGVSASEPHLIAWAQAAVEYDRAHK